MSDKEITQTKPIIAITMGDAAGVGPEIVVKAMTEEEICSLCRLLVVWDAGVLAGAGDMLKIPLALRLIAEVAEARFEHGKMDIFDLVNVELGMLKADRVSAMAGRAAVEYVVRAVKLALSGEIDAIVTALINKEAINLAGYDHIGHPEILADLTKTQRCTTMLVAGSLRVTHVTRHIPLRQVSDLITKDKVLETILVTAEGLHQFGIEHPCLGVAALNPHGGEGGFLGREGIDEVAPAVEEAYNMGIDARGPYPADSIFLRALAGDFDAVVAMYHDQRPIPVKVHDFEGSVTVTLGYP